MIFPVLQHFRSEKSVPMKISAERNIKSPPLDESDIIFSEAGSHHQKCCASMQDLL
jgi:hypothetical protein